MKEKTLLKNTAIFAIGNIGSKAIIFLLIPIYTYSLTTQEMGTYDLINTAVLLLSPLLSLSIYEGAYRWLLDYDASKEDVLKTSAALWLLMMFLLGIPVFVIIAVFQNEYMLYYVLMLLSVSWNSLLQYYTRGLRSHTVYCMQGILHALVNLAVSVVMLRVFHRGFESLIWGTVLGSAASSCLMLWTQGLTSKLREGRIAVGLGKALLRYSVALAPNNMCWWIVNFSDRFMLSHYVGLEANGIYAVANKFPSFVQMLTSFFYMAWQEQAVDGYNDEERNQYYTKIFDRYSKFLLSGVIFIIPAAKIFIVLFLESAYGSAGNYIGFMLLGSVFSAFASFYGTGYASTKETAGAFLTTGLAAFVNIAINVIFIPVIGIQAAALSTMVGYLVLWIVRIAQMKHIFDIRLDVRRIGSLSVLAAAMSIAVIHISFQWNVILVAVAFLFALYVNRDTLAVVRKFISPAKCGGGREK